MNTRFGINSFLGAAMLALGLSGCGGGGSASDASTAAPGPATGGTPPTTQPASEFVVFADVNNKLLKGPLDSSSWQPVADASSDQTKWAVVGLGKQLAIFNNAASANNALTIYDVVSGQALLNLAVPKNSFIAGPVFGDASQYLIRTYDATTGSDGNKAIIANFKTGAVISTISSGGIDAAVDALPDGRLYRINSKTGTISTSGADGVWTDIGKLNIPAGVMTVNWRLNHQGTKIAIDYSWQESTSDNRSDIWIADINGANQYRLTSDGYMGLPVWSPDDSKVAFRYDTLARFGATTGRCSYWYVPVQSREVKGLVYDQPHPVATQMRVNNGGVKDYSACKVLAWEK